LLGEAQPKVLAKRQLSASNLRQFHFQKTSQKQDFDFQSYRLIKAAAANYIIFPV
jgi:hypothetical protein